MGDKLAGQEANSTSNSVSVMEKEGVEEAPMDRKRTGKGSMASGKSRVNGAAAENSTGERGCESEHEVHIWTERERRKKMKNMFSSIQALLPDLPPKADKSTIVDEAVSYIKRLQHSLQTLQKRKQEKLTGSIATLMTDHFETSMVTPEVQKAMPEHYSKEALLADHQAQSSDNNLIGISDMANRFPQCLPATNCFQFRTWFSPNVVINMNGNDAHFSICSVKKPGLLSTLSYILQKHNLEVVSAQVSSTQYHCMYMIHAHATYTVSDDQFLETLSVEETFKLAAGEMNLWLMT